MRIFLPAILFFCLSASCFAQVPQGGGIRGNRGGQQMTGSFYGKIVDSLTNKPIELASVQLVQNRFDSVKKVRKEVIVSGMLTRANGEFSLENIPVFGQFKLRISVVGFKPVERNVSFDLKRNGQGGDMSSLIGALDKDLGNIRLYIEDKVLDNVTVTSSKPLFQMGIDKKVFNVDKNIVSAGGSGVDVMRSVPSLNVDIDGNVTLRNNAPQIFVDGRPTTMALDQIPADAIESVEIITNPSAKYDASGGTAGILNIVLKKNRKVGYNGNIRTNIDSRGRLGAGADINLRQNKVNVFASLNFNQRRSISNGQTERTTFLTDTTTSLKQTDKSTMNGNFRFARAGFDYFISNRNTLSVTGNFGRGTFKPYSVSDIYTDYLTSPAISTFNERNSNSTNEFRNTGVQLGFKHTFPKSGQELTADVTYNSGKNNSSNLVSTNYFALPGNTLTGTYLQRQDGKGTNKNLILQSDYVNPIGEKIKLEMGVRVAIRSNDSKNDFFVYDNGSGDFIFNPLLSNKYNSKDQVYAAYTTFTNQLKSFGYQLGLRAESSNYEGVLPDKNESFKINFPISFFPSVFLSQKLGGDQELQLNYTRRINRPNFFQLYPYIDYSDSLNLRRGNPNLKPEFTNSFELSYMKIFKNKDNFIASVYYKNTNDLITSYLVPDSTNGKPVFLSTYTNANSGYVTGVELISKNKITKWWDITSNFNLYTSKIKIDDPSQQEQPQFASWFAKVSNSFKLPKNFSVQLSGDYQSRTILPPGGSSTAGGGGGGRGGGGFFGQASASQGYIRPNYGVDAAVRYEFLKNKTAALSLNVNDIFKTRKQDIHSESMGFTQDALRRRDARIFRLNFSWRFGKFDAALFKRKNSRSDNFQNDTGAN